jgi:hypothetical protein
MLSDVSVIGRNGVSVKLPSLTLFEKTRSFIVLYRFGSPWPHVQRQGSETSVFRGLLEMPADSWMEVSGDGIDRITGRIGRVPVSIEGIEISKWVFGGDAAVRFRAAKCSKQI